MRTESGHPIPLLPGPSNRPPTGPNPLPGIYPEELKSGSEEMPAPRPLQYYPQQQDVGTAPGCPWVSGEGQCDTRWNDTMLEMRPGPAS